MMARARGSHPTSPTEGGADERGDENRAPLHGMRGGSEIGAQGNLGTSFTQTQRTPFQGRAVGKRGGSNAEPGPEGPRLHPAQTQRIPGPNRMEPVQDWAAGATLSQGPEGRDPTLLKRSTFLRLTPLKGQNVLAKILREFCPFRKRMFTLLARSLSKTRRASTASGSQQRLRGRGAVYGHAGPQHASPTNGEER